MWRRTRAGECMLKGDFSTYPALICPLCNGYQGLSGNGAIKKDTERGRGRRRETEETGEEVGGAGRWRRWRGRGGGWLSRQWRGGKMQRTIHRWGLLKAEGTIMMPWRRRAGWERSSTVKDTITTSNNSQATRRKTAGDAFRKRDKRQTSIKRFGESWAPRPL